MITFTKIIQQILPPIVITLSKKLITHKNFSKRSILHSFKILPRSQQALFKLINDYDFQTILDVGSGAGEHSKVLANYGKTVTSIDFGRSVYALQANSIPGTINNIKGDFYEITFKTLFDCVWASHVLEHQPNPGIFIKRCMQLTKPNGIICITVPPLKHNVVGGHLTLWNAGILLYNLVFNGLDCKDASILTNGSNITVIVKNIPRGEVDLDWDKGDIKALKQFFPDFVEEPFDGRIESYNW